MLKSRYYPYRRSAVVSEKTGKGRPWTRGSHEKGDSLLKGINETVSDIFSLTTKLLAGILIIVFVVSIVRSYLSDDFILEKIEASPELEASGYGQKLIMNCLLNSIQEISNEAKSKSDFKEYISTNEQPDVKADFFGSGLSVEQVFNFITELLGQDKKFIRCQFIKNDNRITLYLHIINKPIFKIKQDDADIDLAMERLLKKAAIEILKVSDPTTLAYYYYRKRNYDQASKAAWLALNNNPNDKKWAYNLLGKIHNENERYDSAIFALQKAIAIDSGFISAFNNLGIAYSRSSQDTLALDAFLRCIKSDKSKVYKEGWYMTGNMWIKLANYDTAVYYYKQSIKIDSRYALAWNGLGDAYNKIGKHKPTYYDSALAILHPALQMAGIKKKEKGLIWITLGETMFYKGNAVEFYNCILNGISNDFAFTDETLQLDPYNSLLSDNEFMRIIKPTLNSIK